MKITSSELRDLSIVIALEEPDLFDLTFEAKFRSRDNGLTMQVNRLRALVDLKDGSVIVNAYGHLYNKDGSVGERSREQYLETDQIPVEVRFLIAEEARHVRDLIGAVQGVRFA
jgi:hypothetical protein